MKTIKIFLASSKELRPEREMMASLANSLNTVLEKQGVQVIVVEWENLDSSMGTLHKQEEYNEKLCDCEMCLVLYWTNFGIYTKTELDTAYNELKAGKNPKKLYVYFKSCSEPSKELKEFRESFPAQYGHFYTSFENLDTLKAHFLLQFMEYQSQILQNSKAIEVKDGKVVIGDIEYVNLKNVPFAGNNEEYKELQKSIKRTQKLLTITDEDDPDFEEYTNDLQELQDKLYKMENSLWDTALMITRLSTTKCSERLQRAMELLSKGDHRGARAILNEEEIDSDIERNIKLIELGEEGRKGLIINVDEYRLKIKVLHCSLHKEDYEKIVALRQIVLDLCVRLYGECSINVAEEHHELATEFELIDNYAEAQTNYEKAIDILNKLSVKDSLRYADILRGLGRLHVTNDMYLKGKPYLEQALAILEDKFGENNLTYVKSLRDMSLFYRNMALYDEAIESARKALDLLVSLPDFDKGLYNSIKRTLALAYSIREKDKDDLDKAVDLLKEVYSSEVEDKKASIHNLYLIGYILEKNHGWPLKNNAKLIEAADYYTKALTIAKEIDDKKSINNLLKNIGDVYRFLGTPKKAEALGYLIEAADYYTKALTIAKEIDDKKSINNLLKNIGDVYKFLGAPEKAEALGYSYPIEEADDGRTLSEVILEYRKEKEKIDIEVARMIANLYLDKFPRKQSYGVTLTSTEDDSEMTFYHELSKEEIEVLRDCTTIAFEEDCTIDEVLSEEGHEELYKRLVDHDTLMPLNIIDSIDLDNPLKFSGFSFQSINDDGALGYKYNIGTNLTDDEFKEILIELLLNVNRYSMNMLVYHKPELCQKIIKHLTFASMDYQFENWHSYIADMCEHKDICEKILNPFKDILNIFNSENKDISDFALRHQIVPEDENNEIYVHYEETDSFHCLMNFQGTRLKFEQEGITIKGKFHDLECFNVDAKKLMEKFSLKEPKEILPYLKEHYNTPDCFYRIKKEFAT